MASVFAAIFVIVVILAIVALLASLVVTRLYRKVPQGQALIVSKTRDIEVTFTGALVVPVVHRAELMDIGVKRIEIEKTGTDGLICRDNIRADIKVSFYVRVNNTSEDVRKVAQLVGTSNASSAEKLDELFTAKFAEALKTAGKQMDFVELYDKRESFRTNVIGVIGEDLNGYVLDDVAIETLEQTSIASLDPMNVLDAEGIKKITQITTRERIMANDHAREAEKQIKAKDVETQQAIFEMDRQERAAEYRAQREMATTKAREESMTAQVESEERLKSEQARLKTDEMVGVQQQNLQREIDVAAKNRERVVAVEEVKIEKARQLENVAKEIETLSASKELETEKARVGELAKVRIAVEKTVAEQEESILTLRKVEEANRERESTVIRAGAEAEASLIITIKEAEASETAASHKAKERVTMAEAFRSASGLEAEAKIKIADATRAEAAASGLADVEVKRAEAAAIEQTGQANARVKELDAAAEQKLGEAMASVTRLAGEAEGAASEAKLKGEAAGLIEKAEAMKQLEGVGQEYDLAVKRIDSDLQTRLASVNAQKDLGVAQAEALGGALAKANIDIVGGTDMFVDRILGAVSAGKALDGFAGSSATSLAVTAPYTNGDKDLIETVASAVSGLGASGIAGLSLARVLNMAADRLGGSDGDLLRQLVGSLEGKGLDSIPVGRLLNK
jgi:uncharacterized membrane protein YqiK